MNKCNYNNSLDTTKHMFIIVKPLTNQVIVNSRTIGNARFFQDVLKTIFRNQYYQNDNYNLICVDRGTFDYELQRKWNPYENMGEVLEQPQINYEHEYLEPFKLVLRAF